MHVQEGLIIGLFLETAFCVLKLFLGISFEKVTVEIIIIEKELWVEHIFPLQAQSTRAVTIVDLFILHTVYSGTEMTLRSPYFNILSVWRRCT